MRGTVRFSRCVFVACRGIRKPGLECGVGYSWERGGLFSRKVFVKEMADLTSMRRVEEWTAQAGFISVHTFPVLIMHFLGYS